jgi:hypothetical protein
MHQKTSPAAGVRVDPLLRLMMRAPIAALTRTSRAPTSVGSSFPTPISDWVSPSGTDQVVVPVATSKPSMVALKCSNR